MNKGSIIYKAPLPAYRCLLPEKGKPAMPISQKQARVLTYSIQEEPMDLESDLVYVAFGFKKLTN